MNESPMEQASRLRLEEARRELTDDGWEVLPADRLAELIGPTLSTLAPDIVARKGAELLVGEVKSRNSRELGDLNKLADAVAAVPNARLEVYWLGDEPESDPERELIRQYAAEAAALLHAGHARAAVATAWSALEGALIYYAAESRAPLPAGERPAPQQAWSLLSQLYSLGYIRDVDYNHLHELRKLRNAAVHFTGSEAPAPAQIDYALNIVDRMLSGLYTSDEEADTAPNETANILRVDRWDQDLDPVVANQVDYIVSAFGERGTAIGVVTASGGVGYMYAEGHLIVREEFLGQVQQMLPQAITVERITNGIMLVRMAADTSRAQHTVPDLLSRIDAEFGKGIATPNHLLTVAPGGPRPYPATEPQEVYDGIEPIPSVDLGNGGAGVLIYVADTGLLKGASASAPWLDGVQGDPDLLPKPLHDGTQPIPPYAGHGTFVAGVVRCTAPQADIFVANIFNTAGSALETDFVRKLDVALDLGVDIFHLSVTSPARNDMPMLSLSAWLERVRQYKGVVVVVAAGDSNSRVPEWPAAFPGTVSVGALAADWHNRADFSNYGGWVDVYAPGRGLISAYATGTYTCNLPPYEGQERKFYGMARWSGTSFSAPIVTGLIAARMSRTGENGQQAAAALLAEAHTHAIPEVGAVLLPPRSPSRETR